MSATALAIEYHHPLLRRVEGIAHKADEPGTAVKGVDATHSASRQLYYIEDEPGTAVKGVDATDGCIDDTPDG